ncbi:MAG TPA: hypothetical protein VHZ31_05780 [Solirubrobacteraceae bacterium]|nr:hypothetical protein [Solirubrobacteraceae bacterium]
MTRLPTLQDELVRAAHRRERWRRLRSWRAVVAGAAIALTISGVSLAATGSRVPVISGLVGGGADTLVPKSPAAARRVSLGATVLALINRANEDVFAAQPRCRPPMPRPGRFRVTHARPSGGVLRLVRALRRPPSRADVRTRSDRALRFVGGEVYIDYVRRLAAAGGERFLVVVSHGSRHIFRPRPGCLQAQHDRLVSLLAHRGPRLRSAALTEFSHVRRGQEHNLLAATAPRDTIALIGAGGSGMTDARTLRTHGAFAAGGASGAATTLTGLLPDGVASITLDYPSSATRGRDFKPVRYRTAYRRTVRVHDNVVTAHVPRRPQDAFPPRMIWRDAHGRVIRVVREDHG